MANNNNSERVLAPRQGQPELVVIFRSAAEVKVSSIGLRSQIADVSPVQSILNRHGASLKLLFGQDEERLRRQQRTVVNAAVAHRTAAGPPSDSQGDLAQAEIPTVPDLSSFYRVHASPDSHEQLLQDLNAQDDVEAAYIVPAGAPPQWITVQAPFRDAPPTTPNFVSRQAYLGPAPAGINAIYAQSLVGGKGEKMGVIDCEWGWRFTHEDLLQNSGGVVAGTNSTDTHNVNHGTAVAGIISGDINNVGILGIAPAAIFSASSFEDQSTSIAIKVAADKLQRGDVILLEIHRGGPNRTSTFNDQQGYIAIEWWPHDFAAIQYAIAKGIVVVEAAGNGAENLDDVAYERPGPGDVFPPWWKNPFNPNNPSSGAILVGAGAPPPGTHGRDWGPDRSRLDFSNWGSRVDCQGWGREVTSTGGLGDGTGDLQGGSEDTWYTDQFSGTSSASPIITGAVLAIQGIRKDFGRNPLTSEQLRTILRATGSPQQDGFSAPATQRIGNRPDMKQLIPAATSIP